jgi:hypothetical protein
MSDDIAREVTAKYAVTGPRVELERTLQLEPGEILIVGVISHTPMVTVRLTGADGGFFGCPPVGCASCGTMALSATGSS